MYLFFWLSHIQYVHTYIHTAIKLECIHTVLMACAVYTNKSRGDTLYSTSLISCTHFMNTHCMTGVTTIWEEMKPYKGRGNINSVF